jgi:hypothetical protein
MNKGIIAVGYRQISMRRNPAGTPPRLSGAPTPTAPPQRAISAQYAIDLGKGRVAVEPVEGLRHGDRVRARAGKRQRDSV